MQWSGEGSGPLPFFLFFSEISLSIHGLWQFRKFRNCHSPSYPVLPVKSTVIRSCFWDICCCLEIVHIPGHFKWRAPGLYAGTAWTLQLDVCFCPVFPAPWTVTWGYLWGVYFCIFPLTFSFHSAILEPLPADHSLNLQNSGISIIPDAVLHCNFYPY